MSKNLTLTRAKTRPHQNSKPSGKGGNRRPAHGARRPSKNVGKNSGKNTSRNNPKTPFFKDISRLVVFLVLQSIFQSKQTLEVAFTTHSKLFEGADSGRDKAFAYTLAAGVVRYALFLDSLSAKHLQKPFDATSDENLILRMGLYQLLFMDGVKDHAAISTTVDLMKAMKKPHLGGVTNAVLRQVQRENEATPIKLNAEKCLPQWFADELTQTFGAPALPELAGKMLEQADVDIRVYEGTAPEGATPLEGLTKSYRLPEGTHASSIEGLNEGGLYIQDMAAQWPAEVLATAVKAKGKKQAVVDMCAAPGGKTLQLLDLLPNEIIAADINPKRLKRLAENMAHMPRQPLTLTCDGYAPSIAANSIAGVLLDAPCTATGTSRRHPEVLHLRQPADLQYLLNAQQKMLEKAAELLVAEGVLVYAVCSLFHKEGEAQDAWALETLPLKPLPFAVPPALKHAQEKPHTLRLTPKDGCDGFFIACYEKMK